MCEWRQRTHSANAAPAGARPSFLDQFLLLEVYRLELVKSVEFKACVLGAIGLVSRFVSSFLSIAADLGTHKFSVIAARMQCRGDLANPALKTAPTTTTQQPLHLSTSQLLTQFNNNAPPQQATRRHNSE